jgi:polyphosphate:AMP phosphotransferase
MKLDEIDLSLKLEKSEYKKIFPKLQLEIGELQRKLREQKIPVIIVFEGWGAAGKGTQINNLILCLDPRGFNVYLTKAEAEEEAMRPFLWRFWIKTPSYGRIAIFDRSWYRRVLHDRIEKKVNKEQYKNAYNEINIFEKQLVDSGFAVVKFFLHISKKEQKKRFKKLLEDPATCWKVSKNDLKQNKNYNKFKKCVQDMLNETSTPFSPWTVVEANDHRFATIKIIKTLINVFSHALEKTKALKQKENIIINQKIPDILGKADLSLSLNREIYEKYLKDYREKLRELEHKIYIKRIPVIIVYEGWDASGKGGNIRRLVQGLDPRGYEVVPISAPNDIEKEHHYLWRFWLKIPKAGHITIFDRSWYGRVLVERIEKFCSNEEWQRAYREICEFEKMCTDYGIVIIKFWMHISPNEQLKRFKQRQQIPYKRWKITDEDWRNREKWGEYEKAVNEMIFRTSTKYAPWTIVEANCKLYARIKTMKTVIKALEKKL